MANGSDRDIFLLNAADDTISVYTYSANNSNGFSDEKIILNTDNSSDNWANTLVLNGTPGLKNSVSPRENDLSVDEILITPNPQIADEPLDALVKILNLGTDNAATFDVRLFNDENFNSTPDGSELIDSFTLNNLASGDSATQNFNLGTFT
ncbi:MAG: CARDB domain-containing protein [Melioribacteraceae bacterium]|nr:CARDB domain-containing protein [Melioribacteraceae bacterium]